MEPANTYSVQLCQALQKSLKNERHCSTNETRNIVEGQTQAFDTLTMNTLIFSKLETKVILEIKVFLETNNVAFHIVWVSKELKLISISNYHLIALAREFLKK